MNYWIYGLFLTSLSLICTVFSVPLPSAESVFPKAYLTETEGQTTSWRASNVETRLLTNKTNNENIPKVFLNFGQKNRHTRQTESLATGTLPALYDYLFFANRQFLVKINRDGTGAQSFQLTRSEEAGGPFNAIACDFDARDHALFWSDVQTGTLYGMNENGTGLFQVLNANVVVPDGMAWDWINKKMYWTDAGTKTLEVYDPLQLRRRILFRTGNTSNPRAIVLDPTTKQMYWTDWGENPSIQRASMDGTSRISLHTTGLGWPNGMTIDYATQTLYWADASLDRIETSSVDGTGRRVLTTQYIFHPFGITFFRGSLYWTDWQVKALLTVPVNPPMTFGIVIQNLILNPMAIHVYSLERQPSAPNPCETSNGGCSHLCLLSTNNTQGFTCVCPDGMYISTDRRNCLSGAPLPIPPEPPLPMCIPECQNNGLCISPAICGCMAGWRGPRCEQPICTPQCQNGGTCVDVGVCSCNDDWEGSTCEQPVCDNGFCLNGGTCIRPNVCSCPLGWDGPRCERPVCNPDCVNGICTEPDTCSCNHNWEGDLCNQPICRPDCVNGDCIRPDVCLCQQGWRGVLCDMPVCRQPCRNGGRCVGPDTCECSREYTGALCENAVCFPPTGCLNGGVCLRPSICVCQYGWTGRQCERPSCDTCVHGRCLSVNNCSCHTGWEGPGCNQAVCFPPDGCLNGGYCDSPGTCLCPHRFIGSRCEDPVCSPQCFHGNCYRNPSTGEHECRCNIGWEGPQCSQAICHPECANGGTCIFPGHCACPLGIGGTRCEDRKD